jgi:hypothetical protein
MCADAVGTLKSRRGGSALALSAVEWVGEVISDSRQVDGRAYGPAFFCPKVVFFVAIN